MFTKIRLKNFYSFKDLTFDLSDGANSCKPLAIVYGENGSGKTNLMLGFSIFIDLMRTMDVRDILERLLYDQDSIEGANESSHKFSPKMVSYLAHILRTNDSLFSECRMVGSTEPVLLQYEFVINSKKGIYTVEFGVDGISHERLEFLLQKRRGIYYDLTPDDKLINKVLFKNDVIKADLEEQIRKFWGKHTFLAIVMHEINDKSEQYFQEGLHENFLKLISKFYKVSCQINATNNLHATISKSTKGGLLSDMESGTISKDKEYYIDRTEIVLNSLFRAINCDNKKLYYKKKINNEDRISYELHIKKMISGQVRDLPFTLESYGNHQIIAMLPFLLRALAGETVVLDESDTGIHDLLYSKIISEAIPYIKGQLIITTHNTLLLDINNIKDFVYIMRQNEEADREVVPIALAGDRIYQQTSIKNKYLVGAYGGAPHVDVINFKEMIDTLSKSNFSECPKKNEGGFDSGDTSCEN